MSVALVAVLASGCGVILIPYDILAPEALPAGTVGRVNHAGWTTVKLQGLRVRIKTRNIAPTHGFAWTWIGVPLLGFPTPASAEVQDTYHRPIIVFIRFDVKEAGYTFDPSKATIRRDGGTPLAPSGHSVAGRAFLSDDCLGNGIVQPLEAKPRASEPLMPGTKTCFLVVFDTPPPTDGSVRLEVDGLARDGREVSLPGITMQKRRVRTYLVP